MILYTTPSVNNFNLLLSESKRFLAYEIVKRLKGLRKNDLLKTLQEGVQENEKSKGKIHQVFRLSFDAKELDTLSSVARTLDYIHRNPVQGKWNLVNDFVEYPYSSARFYELGELSEIEIEDSKKNGVRSRMPQSPLQVTLRGRSRLL